MNEKLFRKGENHKAQGWYLKGGEIELFITEQGGQHAPVTFFADSEKPVQPYYLTPWQDEHPDLSFLPLLQYLRGDFFCLPFGGNGDPVDGFQYQCHGETSAANWTLTSAEENGDVTIFELELDTKIKPAHVVKHYEMRKGESAIYIRHTVTGLSGKMPYGHHAIMKMPEANEKMYFSCGKFDLGMTPTSVFSDPANLEYQYLASGEEFTSLEAVPTAFKKPAYLDCSVYPYPVGYTDLFAMLKKPSDTPAWAAASYPDQGYLYFSLKNAEELPATTLWVANGGRHGAPWNSVTRCFAVEESCSYFADGWKPSIEENALTRKGWKTCGEFSPDKPFTVSAIQGVVRIPADYGKTASAVFEDGKVIFTDEAGHSVEAAVHWDFLCKK
ncbi:MAG: hypothetical protein J6W81_04235 [Lentisphaeria bacterium]|nr:hypothetical protein [Lentisphaeria bacterium]